MTNIKNIPHLVVIVVSLFVSTAMCYAFLAPLVGAVFGALGAGSLSFLTHYYLLFSLRETIQNKRLHQSLIIAFVLVSIVMYCEFSGVHVIATNNNVDRTELNEIKKSIQDYNKKLSKIATSRKWQDIESKRLISSNLERANMALINAQKDVKIQQQKADEQTRNFRFFSVVMLVVSCVASSCIKQTVSDNSIEPFLQASTMKTQTVEQTVKPTVDGSYTAKEGDLRLLSEQERIALASEHIKHTNETDHRLLAKRFFLSFKAVKIAKEKSGVSRLKEQSQIGF